MAAFIASFSLLAITGEPQCPTDIGSCLYSFADTKFGEANAGEIYDNSMLCNHTNQLKKDLCSTSCPLRLTITDPPELRMQVCVQDNVFMPYLPEAHLDMFHPLNNKVVEIMAPGVPTKNTRHGCMEEDFVDKDFTGKLAVIQRGSCYFEKKFRSAKASGAVAGLMVNNAMENSVGAQLFSMSGPSNDGFLAGLVPRHHGDLIFEALDAGKKVFGKYSLNCELPEVDEDTYPTDGCPDFSLTGRCGFQEEEKDRMCDRCPLDLSFDQPYPYNRSFCLYGNDLLPRSKMNLFQLAPNFTLPMATEKDELVYLRREGVFGCQESDWKDLSGKIVFMPFPVSGCLPFKAALHAQKMGVRGLIVQTTQYHTWPMRLSGISTFLHIPVHTIAAKEMRAFRLVAERATKTPTVDNIAYLSSARFSVGPYPPRKVIEYVPVPDKIAIAESVTVEHRPDWEWSETVVVSLILIIVLGACLAYLFYRQRRDAVDLPSENNEDGFAVPLGAASMGLSLSLLLIIATVAFSLAYAAGQSSTSTAVDDGRNAAAAMYDNAVDNVKDLATRLRQNIMQRIGQGLRDTIDEAEIQVKGTRALYFGLDESWASFEKQFVTFSSYGYYSAFTPAVFTKKGFFATYNYMTDNRPDDVRRDGVNGSVAVTNNGYLYGTSQYNYVNDKPQFHSVSSLYEYQPMNMLGGGFGDPLAIVADKPKSYMQWYVTQATFPQVADINQPICVFSPLHNRDGDYLGTIETRTSLDQFGSIVTNAVSDYSLNNMTVVIFYRSDQTILATNAWVSYRRSAMVYKTTWSTVRMLYTLGNIPPVQVKAYANYVKNFTYSDWGDSKKMLGEFDQNDYWSEQPELTHFWIRVQDDKIQDTSMYRTDVEMINGGGTCDGACKGAAPNSPLGSRPLVFDGATTLNVYNNITVDMPEVASTRMKTSDGKLSNSVYAFREHTVLGNNRTWCVSYNDTVDANFWRNKCLLRDPVVTRSFTISMRIKPAELYDTDFPSTDTPRLFTDAAVGDPNVRLFANGQLYMNVLTYGCRTKAYKGGFPVGEWVTIAARINWSGRYCAVYINGRLSSYGYMTSLVSTSNPEGGYLIGDKFKGEMDDIRMFTISLSSTEILNLHREKRFLRDVAKREYFHHAQRFNYDSGSRGGLDLVAVTLLPKADIMRTVDENNRITMLNLKVQEDNTQKKLRQKSNETVMIIIVIALVSVAIFLVFNDVLTKPFATVACVMTEAAVMKVDEIEEGKSYIKELNAINRAMTLMLKNLKEYKSYMPQSLQLDGTEDEEEQTQQGLPSTGGTSIAHTAARSVLSTGSRGSGITFGSGGSTFSKGESARLHAGVAGQKRQGMALSLTKKRFTFLVVNVKDWHERIHSTTDVDLITLHSNVVQVVLGVFMFTKGIAESFSGDRFLCTFNAAKSLGTHRIAGCAAGCAINEKLSEELKLNSSISCVSGEGRLGNMGTEMMKKFTFMSPVITWGFALERYCRTWDLTFLVDSYVYEDCKQHFKVKLIDEILFPKRLRSRALKVAEIPGKKEVGDSDEWMYELEAGERSDYFKVWNEWVTAIFAENFDVCHFLLRSRSHTHPHTHTRLYHCCNR